MDFDVGSDGSPIPSFLDLSTASPYNFATFRVVTGRTGNYPVTFDTQNPVCDSDLGTPNAEFGGPGVGCAGSGSTGGGLPQCANEVQLGNCMAIQEAPSRACAGHPDDEANGGSIFIDFDRDVRILSIRKVDAEDARDEWITRNSANTIIGRGNFINCDTTGCVNNGVYVDRGMENVLNVRSIELDLRRSGCFDALTVCVPP